ncbi:histone H4 [Chloropicon primus]|uniref:Histone H4 n=1 Tax=Chloropicon primus TaxID=1764295 RepID=A0A5B8MQ77_9CHLO|nr:histone H4 [Chloropicon primus]UPR01732.1 histone H4 [Chloropicon primus]|eukprot:QDZ22511.1 histone H4 [Chloropicon primus]
MVGSKGGGEKSPAGVAVSQGLKRRVLGKWRAQEAARIGTPSIRRLARKGGVKRISKGVYEETRICLRKYLEKILKDLVLLVEHAGRYTVSTTDVLFALKRNGQHLYGYGDFTYPLTRQQRVAKLRSRKIRLEKQRRRQQPEAEGQGEGREETERDSREASSEADLQKVVELVQKTLADYFLRERADVCTIRNLHALVNRSGPRGGIALAGGKVSEEDLRTCLSVLQDQNCIMCSSHDIYLI